MVPRFTGASLGLLAFATTMVAGLYVGNPPMVTLSRSILALFAFCVIGLLLGRAAQAVVSEYERSRRDEFERRSRADSAGVSPDPAREGRVESGVAS